MGSLETGTWTTIDHHTSLIDHLTSSIDHHASLIDHHASLINTLIYSILMFCCCVSQLCLGMAIFSASFSPLKYFLVLSNTVLQQQEQQWWHNGNIATVHTTQSQNTLHIHCWDSKGDSLTRLRIIMCNVRQKSRAGNSLKSNERL